MGGENLAQVFEYFHSLTVALERGMEQRVKTITAQVLSPLEQRNLLQSQLPALPTGSESSSFVCKSHCHLKNKPTRQRTSVRKQIQVPVADWVSKEDWTLARLTLAELQCEAISKRHGNSWLRCKREMFQIVKYYPKPTGTKHIFLLLSQTLRSWAI